MNIRHRLSAEATRERIIAVAEEHFRRVGYAKTAVADIAAALGMSPANIYRFFPSKSAINDAICAKMMHEVDDMAREILARPLPAPEKLRIFLLELHRHNKSTLTHEHRIHDMVEVAMAENWPAIKAHIDSMVGVMAEIIGEGILSGHFRTVLLPEFAQTALEASAKIIHPTLIAHSADEDQEEQTGRLTDLILAALRP
ncbi:TetR/AcrR family transcriptional regulator [Rhabdaerophilum sp. SD176]|uniref:TetR/AcrR family transcriptional regulator n=1 Tax=Rhabdaerophilum sp. SD176 TaxID=2983548 RepID=UPI0024DFCA08|nr:TetR/AcrR family transcriptional regulator [Rhabdaerophilum sp. SD176]